MGGRRGTTLVELLVATVFLGICAGSIISCITSMQLRSSLAKRRAVALRTAENLLEQTRANGRSAPLLTVATPATNVTLPGATAQASTSIRLVSGYTDLYEVTATVTWTERAYFDDHIESIRLDTLVRAPDG